MPTASSARHASRSWLQRSPPLAAASAASFPALRPSSTGSGISRSPLLSGNPPSVRISSNAFRCCVVPSRPVAPSITTPIVFVAIVAPSSSLRAQRRNLLPLWTFQRRRLPRRQWRLGITLLLSRRSGDRVADDLRKRRQRLARRHQRRSEADGVADRRIGTAAADAQQQATCHR